MRAILLVAVALAASGCTGGDSGGSSHCKVDDSDSDFVLTTGTYDLHDVDVISDGCQIIPDGGLSFASVSVSGSTVTIGALVLDRTSDSLAGSGFTTNDQAPFDCVTRISLTATGEVTGDDAFVLDEEEIVITTESGTECNEATGVLIPCSTKISFCAEKP